MERCIKDLTDDLAKGVKLHVSDPIITFKETIVNTYLADKRKRVKGGAKGQQQWEQVETSSEEEVEEKKADEEKTLEDIMGEYEALLK